jgi:hypothetical protein
VLREKPTSFEDEADKIARVLLAALPDAAQDVDGMVITTSYGWDIGLASNRNVQAWSHSIPEWRNRLSMRALHETSALGGGIGAVGFSTPTAVLRISSPTVSDDNTLSLRFPLRRHVRFLETTSETLAAPTASWKEQWFVPTRREPDGTQIYKSTVSLEDGYNEWFVASDGAQGNWGTWSSRVGGFSVYEPRQVVLPAQPTIGASWQSEHRLLSQISPVTRVSSKSRRCVIEAWSRCADGITSRCVSDLASGQTVEIAAHFCPGVGWVGEDDVVNRDGKVQLEVHQDKVEDAP